MEEIAQYPRYTYEAWKIKLILRGSVYRRALSVPVELPDNRNHILCAAFLFNSNNLAVLVDSNKIEGFQVLKILAVDEAAGIY